MPFDFQLTDDQVALLGCFLAIGASLLLMSLSFHARQIQEPQETTAQANAIKLPIPQENRKAA